MHSMFSVGGFGPNNQNKQYTAVILQLLFRAADNCVANSEAFAEAVVLTGHRSHMM